MNLSLPFIIQQTFNRRAASYDQDAVLQQEVAQRLMERFELIQGNPKTVLDVGCGTGFLTRLFQADYPKTKLVGVDWAENMLAQHRLHHSSHRWWHRVQMGLGLRAPEPQLICADVQNMPLADDTVDWAMSNLMLQWLDEPALAFRELNRVLKTNGLWMFTTLGPSTLRELRLSWMAAEVAQAQGLPDVAKWPAPEQLDSAHHPYYANHVNVFEDMHNLGDMLVAEGFTTPVMDQETITLTYDSVLAGLKDLKHLGVNTVKQAHRNRHGLGGRHGFQRMCAYYELHFKTPDGRFPMSYEVIYGHAWVGQMVFKGPNHGLQSQAVSLDNLRATLPSKCYNPDDSNTKP